MPGIFYVSYVFLWLLVLVLAVLLLLVYRHFGIISLGTLEGVQRDGLPIGESAPAFKGFDTQHELVEWSPKSGQAYLLAFVSPTCAPCQKVLPSLLRFATLSDSVNVVFIISSPGVLLEKFVQQYNPPPLVTCVTDEGNNIYEDYRVRAMPFAFIIAPDQSISAKTLCDVANLTDFFKAGQLTVPEGFSESLEQIA